MTHPLGCLAPTARHRCAHPLLPPCPAPHCLPRACSIIAHGTANLLQERLFLNSDAYRVHTCDVCGLIAIANLKTMSFKCGGCESTKLSQVRPAASAPVASGPRACCNNEIARLPAPPLRHRLPAVSHSCHLRLPCRLPASCHHHDDHDDCAGVQVYIPYACKLMFQELMAMQIAPRLLTSAETAAASQAS